MGEQLSGFTVVAKPSPDLMTEPTPAGTLSASRFSGSLTGFDSGLLEEKHAATVG